MSTNDQKIDHNLDDLIINEEPEKGKGKGILAIIALLITILILAFFMTRIFLNKNENNSTIVIEDKQEDMISPELKLDSSKQALEADKKELDQLSSILEDELTNKAPDTNIVSTKPIVSIDKSTTASTKNIDKPTIEIKTTENKKSVADTTVARIEKPISKPVEQKEPVAKPKPKPKPKAEHKPTKKKRVVAHKKPESKQTESSGSYYIQVGAFSKAPSQRFLSVITSSGFRYKLKGGKLLIGPYSSSSVAKRDLSRVKDKINKGAFVKKL
jgi:DedD protein